MQPGICVARHEGGFVARICELTILIVKKHTATLTDICCGLVSEGQKQPTLAERTSNSASMQLGLCRRTYATAY